ncbi:MAG: replication initiator protein [Microvirus sp.]|nr:MAG: replication initiator protein [Microvirus sp.]
MRMYHELGNHQNSIFVTLTYDDNNIPENDSLCKRDLQLFIKRLRKISPNKIKYFAVGEYGDTTDRPHYHLIIFGLSLSSEHKKLILKTWDKCEWSPERIRASFGLAEPFSIQYVAGYIHKKLSGEIAKEEYTEKNREPVFRLLSLGIGRDFCDQNAEQLEQQLHVTVRGEKVALPRYYLNRLHVDRERLKKLNEIKDCEETEMRVGCYMTRDDLYTKNFMTDNVIKNEEGIKKSRVQNECNNQAKLKLKSSKL